MVDGMQSEELRVRATAILEETATPQLRKALLTRLQTDPIFRAAFMETLTTWLEGVVNGKRKGRSGGHRRQDDQVVEARDGQRQEFKKCAGIHVPKGMLAALCPTVKYSRRKNHVHDGVNGMVVNRELLGKVVPTGCTKIYDIKFKDVSKNTILAHGESCARDGAVQSVYNAAKKQVSSADPQTHQAPTG